MVLAVRTPVFEGPLQRLVEAVLDGRVDLWALSVAELVGTFVDGLPATGEGFPLEDASEMAVLAAALAALKARRLVARGSELELDELVRTDRDALLARVVENSAFRRAGAALEALAEEAARSLPRRAPAEDWVDGVVAELPASVDAGTLARRAQAVLFPPPPPVVDTAHLAPLTASLERTGSTLARRLAGRGRERFAEAVSGFDRVEVAVAFVAVLVLYRERLVELDQPEALGTLWLSWLGEDPDEAISRLGWA